MIFGDNTIRNNEQAIKNAKERDKNGEFALMGMDLHLFLSMNRYFDIPDFSNVDVMNAVAYCVDTFIEEINDISFEEWVKNGNEDGRPMIMPYWAFKRQFSEIAENNVTIESMIDDIASIYGIEFWTNDFFEEYDAIIYTTMYKDDYKKIDNKTIAMAMERLMTLVEFEIDSESDREEFIASINLAMNNYLENYKTDKMTTHELLYEINRVTGGYLE